MNSDTGKCARNDGDKPAKAGPAHRLSHAPVAEIVYCGGRSTESARENGSAGGHEPVSSMRKRPTPDDGMGRGSMLTIV